MKQSNEIVTAITKAFISKLASSGDVFTLRNENVALKAELSDLKYKDEAQAKEIEALRKMVISLEREVRSLKEGFDPFPAVASPSLQSKLTKDYSTTIQTKEKRKEKTNMQYQQQDKFQSQQQLQRTRQHRDTHESDMEVDVLIGETHGHQVEGTNMQHQEDWPSGGETLPWSMETQATGNEDEAENNTAKKTKSSDTHKIKTKVRLDNIYSERNSRTGSDIYKVKTNVGLGNMYSERNSKIRLIENKQIVPPQHPSLIPDKEWITVGRRGRFKSGSSQNSYVRADASASLSAGRNTKRAVNSAGNLKKKLAKPAVVTITSKPGGASYADILAKARERVSLKDIGIQETAIRRALNGAIVIEIPGPQSKQLAGVLGSRLSEVLGEEAKVKNPVAMGELRIRGIDPSTTTEEIRNELMTLSDCVGEDLKVSPVNNMRDGMGIA